MYFLYVINVYYIFQYVQYTTHYSANNPLARIKRIINVEPYFSSS